VNIRTLSLVLRVLFWVQLLLGILFWFGVATGLVLVHMLIGIAFVAVLWLLGVVNGLRGGSLGLVLGTFVVGLLLAIVGLTQTRILLGSAHWVIQVIHLLLALVAIGMAEMIAAQARRAARMSAA